MFSAARPAWDGAMRRPNEPSTSWLRLSLAAISRACSAAMRSSAASLVTRTSPCLTRNAVICSAGEASAASAVCIGSVSRPNAAMRIRDRERLSCMAGPSVHDRKRIDVDRRLLVRMNAADRGEHVFQARLGTDRLDALLRHVFELADRADRGPRAVKWPEPAGAL